MNEHLVVLKEFLKRKYIDLVKRGDRLLSPMDVLLRTLNAYGYLPKKMICLDLFGFIGLWVTKDYHHLCDYLEMYEINPIYSKYARKFIKNAVVVNADSVKAVKDGNLKRDKYSFVVIDNPFGCFGNYCEHFDLFPIF